MWCVCVCVCVCSVAAGLRAIVYMHGMQQEGTEEMWDKAWQKYLTNNEPTEKYKLMKALTHTRLVWLIHRSESHHPMHQHLLNGRDRITTDRLSLTIAVMRSVL